MSLRILTVLAALLVAPFSAWADGGSNIGGGGGGGGGSVFGTTSNASSGVATSGANVSNVSYNYGFNGTTWDQLQVDGSKSLKINCITGCSPAGSISNASSGVATSSTNSGVVGYVYGFNGTTWDQLQVDASKFLKVNCATGCTAGSVSNASSGVATSSTNQGSVAYLYGFNGTTWDQLQDDANKNLKVVIYQGNAALSATNGAYSNMLQGNAVLSATNGVYANILQGNAAISATNGLYTNLLQGNAIISAGNPIYVNVVNGISGTNSGTGCGGNCTIGVQGNITATDVPVSVAGTGTNATSAQATTTANVRSISWLYGYNGTTWDQIQVDASKFLKINCSAGCAASGALSNASSGVATSSTNLGVVDYMYAFNGTTWDQVRNQSNASSGVATGAFNLNTISYLYAFNGTTWDAMRSQSNCCGAGTNNTLLGVVNYNYGFNGATWDQLQTDANKYLKTISAGTALVSATQTALHADPCQTQDWIYANISFATATTSTVVAGTGGKKTYVCSLSLSVPTAIQVGVIEGTTATCGSGTLGVIGGITAATGLNFANNGNFIYHGGGHTVFATSVNANNLCFSFSASTQVSGNIVYVQQ